MRIASQYTLCTEILKKGGIPSSAYPAGFQDSGYHNPRSGSRHPSHTSVSTTAPRTPSEEIVQPTSDIVVCPDASGSEGHLGAAVVAFDDNHEPIESQQVQVEPMDRWLVHVAELIDIYHAISSVFKIAHHRPRTADSGPTRATVLCDSISALQTNPPNKSGQRIIHAIYTGGGKDSSQVNSAPPSVGTGQRDNLENDAAID
ncbi:hypothetical protein PENSUB_13417 [Penicillium subrubescens]|uniref:Uncharacterized protein n=1 Tax=Penicillium subrubescens TaxID=1316194 RepID=A0A1Q5SQL6_9EURO|nr:hypothetical protein PENSUB_13417 [Penicillium subrubescens]